MVVSQHRIASRKRSGARREILIANIFRIELEKKRGSKIKKQMDSQRNSQQRDKE
jgi:hypothetical protein